MPTDTDVRLAAVEKRLAELDSLLLRIVTAANAHPIGRRVLAMIGVPPA